MTEHPPTKIRRFRITRIVAKVVALLLILLIAAWICWSTIATHRLRSRINLIRGRGEPIYPGDFNPPALAEDQNAATYLKAAAAAMVPGVDSPSNSNFSFNDYPPFPPDWHRLAHAAIGADALSLALLHQARGYSHAVWVPQINSPTITILLPFLNGARGLANLAGDSAMQVHLGGDDAGSFEILADLMHQSDMVDESNAFLVTRLVSIGIAALGLDRMQVIAADHLKIEGASASPHAVSRAAIQRMIQALLDFPHQQACIHRTLLVERMSGLDNCMFMGQQATVLRPLFKLEAIRMLDFGDAALQAGAQTNCVASQQVFASLPHPPKSTWRFNPAPKSSPVAPRFSRIVSDQLTMSLDRYLVTEWRVESERRLVAVSLALHLYQADHGQFPASLEELVPAYLPAIPDDPFMPTSTPIGYVIQSRALPNGNDRPMLYLDPTGKPDPTPPPLVPQFGWTSSSTRQWRDLTVWVPPPSTLPAN